MADAMPPEPAAIRREVRSYLFSLPHLARLDDAGRAGLTDDTPLVTGGLLDEADVVLLADWLGDRFGPWIDPDEVGMGAFDTIAMIGDLVADRVTSR